MMLILIFVVFISLGLPDALLGVGWTGIRTTFDLPLDAIGFLLVASTAGYMTSSLLTGPLMRRLGVGGLLTVSVAATALALLVYATTPWWPVFVMAATLGGLGGGAIDAAVNVYVARYYSARIMQWLHACFGVGVTAGPLIMTAAITQTGDWQWGYAFVCVLQVILAIVFFSSRGAWQEASTEDDDHEADLLKSLTHLPSAASALLFFIYCGIEVGMGLWIFTLLTESRGVEPAIAGLMTASYWGAFTVGRVLAGLFADRVPIRTLILVSMVGATIGTGLLMLNAGTAVDITGILLTGFSIAPVFPALTSDTAARVGREHELNTIGLQMSAAGFGSAVMPAIAGVLADSAGLEMIPPYIAASALLLLITFLAIGQRGPRDA